MPYVEASVRSRQFVAAARTVMARDGIAKASLRAVAAEAGAPLGTLQYVFPTKEQLLRAVAEDVVDEVARLLETAVPTDQGLARAIQRGLLTFWATLVEDQVALQLMQHELATQALRSPGLKDIPRRQYERYAETLARFGRTAATNAGESCAVPFDQLARLMLGGVDGLILQYMGHPDDARARADLDAMAAMLIALAAPRRT